MGGAVATVVELFESVGRVGRVLFLLYAAMVVDASGCSVGLDAVECTSNDGCGDGQICERGSCQTISVPDLVDQQVDVSEATDLPWECPFDDCPDFNGADEDGDGVDGNTEISIYVDHLGGNDTNLGTYDSPLKSAAVAFTMLSDERYVIILTSGVFDLRDLVTLKDLEFFEIAGGYDRGEGSNWTRLEDARTTLRGASPVLTFVDMPEVRLSGVRLEAGAGGPGESGGAGGEWSDPPPARPTQGDSSIGVAAVRSTVRLYRSFVSANRGGASGRGADGREGAPGSDGAEGDPPVLAGDCPDDGCAQPQGGHGGTLPDWCSDHHGSAEIRTAAGGDGGPGGTGIRRNPGLPGGNGHGGMGGVDGAPDGLGGGDGDAGEDASGSEGFGYVCKNMWFARDGRDGAFGLPGFGGGGGAGGTNPVGGFGGGGAGAGAGGCGGEGGGGGAGGGGSVSILAIDSDVEIVETTLQALSGGGGGAAGASGEGGDGGHGPVPSADPSGLSNLASGGKGGPGGDGGPGGGGAGGDGGLSVALVLTEGSSWTASGSHFLYETGGSGGMGTGGEASRGADGFQGSILVVEIDESEQCPVGN